MCGVAAIFAFNRSSDFPKHIRRMTDVIRHRGPDDEGYAIFQEGSSYVTPFGGPDTPQQAYRSAYAYTPLEPFKEEKVQGAYAALGNRRLSIVDLSPAGHQPMCSADKRLWITYNGEVYNYVELRHDLEAEGYSFQSHSDTEVILNAYKRWGSACLHQFNGMFSFLIFDREDRNVFAARDRFGVKPLYYWTSPLGFIAFASEIKQFTCLPGWHPAVNGQRAYEFLNWGLTDHTSETLFADVSQVRGGEMVECSIDTLRTRVPVTRWYDLRPRPFSGGFEAATEGFRDLLQDAVRLRLRADVPVGSCLSGGLDSSSIVCLANQLLQTQHASPRQKTFSACSHVPQVDERRHIEQIVSKTGVEAHYTFPAFANLFETAQKITWHQDEPFLSTSIYAQWKVFQLVKENGVKVMLDGQGGDEQLGGYMAFFGDRLYDLFKALQWNAWFDDTAAIKRLHPDLSPLTLTANQALPEFIRQPLRHLAGRASTVTPYWLDMRKLGAENQDPFRTEPGKGDNTLTRNAYLQLMKTNLPMLLRFEDRDSMAHSVESRTPFLDFRLVEFTQGLPSAFKLSQGVTKRVLRESMKGVLPEGVRMRMDKIQFATPEETWLREHQPQFSQAVKDAVEHSQGIIRSSATVLLKDVISGKMPFTRAIWRLINFGMWMQQYHTQSVAGV